MVEAVGVSQCDKLKARATYVGGAVNIIQTGIKITFGLLGHSTALLADGLHSLSDLLSDLLVIIAVRLGSREADKDHPYGHRRFETIATVVLGLSLVAVGGTIVWHALEHLSAPETTFQIPDYTVLGIAGISILLNEWLYHFTKGIAKKTRSKLLLANAWHQRSDALSSLIVLLGVGGVLLGYPFADAIAAVVVALMVAKMGLGLITDSIKELVDTSLPPPLVADIHQTILSIEGVKGIHLLRTRQMGEDAYIDTHIVVDPRITVSEGHRIGDAVKDALVSRYDDVIDVLVHVDPEDDQFVAGGLVPLSRNEVASLLDFYFDGSMQVIEDFRIHYLDGKLDLELIVPFAVGASSEQLMQIRKQCQALQSEVKRISHISLLFSANEV